ncbi:MAG TPA: gamma-glutamyltransferase [Sphingomonas sp.]
MAESADGSSAARPASWRDVGAEAIMAEQCQARGRWGIVAAAAPVAARIASETLRAGGNAYDAAVAAALAETVLLPPKCGLGGDLVAIVWEAGKAAPEALIAVGGAPAALARATEAGRLSDTGPFAVGVPAAPAGYAALAARGRLSLDRLAGPAIALAERGFAWARICAVLSDESRALVLEHNPDGTRYYPGRAALRPGDTLRLPGMANMLRLFAGAPAAFLAGPVGDAIVARVAEAGGILKKSDFAFARAEWSDVATLAHAETRLFATPAPTHGPSLLDAVARAGGTGQAEAYRAVLGAIAARRDRLADPSGTSMISAVDEEGTMVTIVHSNSYPRFGSGLIVGDYDLILANRAGRGFSAKPGHPNFPSAGRRPATTLHAWGARLPDGRRLLGATPGGTNQMPWNAATLARLLAGEGDVGRLIVAPRWEWRPADDGVLVEEGFSAADIEALDAAAPSFGTVERWAMRSAMQIMAVDADGGMAGAVDPRTVGGVFAL